MDSVRIGEIFDEHNIDDERLRDALAQILDEIVNDESLKMNVVEDFDRIKQKLKDMPEPY
ncbi:hypothetical protein [Mammaliicoccus sciuri]|uniref:hypothetical protein n=1 Tax=Mammaliicoccus sciuri TaxID=1296 RepID=UPI001E29568C|nr:hypothetical protein [Mammaliicoccus sciuri]MCD8896553.1 hypothetical protein [Mammaliicoccus sciuri]